MLSRRIPAARPLRRLAESSRRPQSHQIRFVSQADVEDPNMQDLLEPPPQNGGYINPPAIKRQFRDPHGDWWDKQERRNYGEPLHEDNDVLGVFSLHEYTHTTPGKGLLQLGAFVACVLGLCGVVKMTYPDRPSAPREFPGGLERELGGPRAVRARKAGDEF
ncbi:MAG: hypothetical protein M1837_000581 [Sclerophora amabilis]|nr:MAG: hypothetical protein M1837_000581 [Sclerophora amabilis]